MRITSLQRRMIRRRKGNPMADAPAERLPLGAQLRRRKPLPLFRRESGADEEGNELHRSFGVLQLTMISIGATLGTGILVILGESVPMAGPAVWISFVIAGFAALLSALSYAELAGRVPVSGSSYSYSFATMGEGMAWVCGWCLVLEYAVSVAAVAVGAGQYVNETLAVFGMSLPEALTAAPIEGGIINLPAVLVVVFATVLLVRGARESSLTNVVMVLIKIAILVFFIIVAFTAFDSGNFAPLLPMGVSGVTGAAAVVFFSYIGFDAASTAGEEAKNPKRDLPRSIVISMLVITALYVLVAVAAIGARPWGWFEGSEAPLVHILDGITGARWPGLIFAVSSVIAIVSVVLTVLYGQTRILMSMSRDGMVPAIFQRVSPRTATPVANTLIVGAAVTVTAGLIPLGELANATSIGTLFAFMLVNIAVILLRRREPMSRDSFRLPLFPLTPILGALICAALMTQLGGVTWIVFLLWMAVGTIVYLAYSRRHSLVGRLPAAQYEALMAEPYPATGPIRYAAADGPSPVGAARRRDQDDADRRRDQEGDPR